jgi:hypothetical protein
MLYASILLVTGVLLFARWPAPVRLGSYHDFVGRPEGLPYVWEDGTFFMSFCTLTLYCAVPLAVFGLLAYRESRAPS